MIIAGTDVKVTLVVDPNDISAALSHVFKMSRNGGKVVAYDEDVTDIDEGEISAMLPADKCLPGLYRAWVTSTWIGDSITKTVPVHFRVYPEG